MNDAQDTTAKPPPGDELRGKVAERYGALARGVLEADPGGGCCGPTSCAPEGNPITTDLYTDQQSGAVPDEMLELARKNQRDAGVENVEFLKGTIEDVPLPDGSVDVIISNCVISLSTDKSEVFREAYRVLRPGGHFAVSDIVIRGELDPTIRHSLEAWIGCVGGALEEGDYRSGLEAAGFVDVEVEPTRIYTFDDAHQFLQDSGLDLEDARTADGKVVSAFVRASKT